nr:energy transducer TonB [uncultured Carboxylicivirga sp.]
MKRIMIVLLLGFMAIGIQAQRNGIIPAQFQTNKIQTLEEVTVRPQSPICCYLQSEIEYPEVSAEILEEGEVVVQFIIEEDGEIRDLEIINSVSRLLDDQVITCLKKTSGSWAPALLDGQAIESTHKLYVIFDVEGNTPLKDLCFDHYKTGVKYSMEADKVAKDVFMTYDKRNKKAERLYNRALTQFAIASKYQAEEASICYWQFKTHEKMGNMSMMKEKMDIYYELLSPDEDIIEEFVTIAYPRKIK